MSKTRNVKSRDESSGESFSHLPIITFPVFKQCELTQRLPRYSAVLSRSVEDGVGMEDLDQLQQDLKRILSNCAIRNRMLKLQIDNMDKVEEHRKSKNGKSNKKQKSLKRKRPDEKTNTKYKEFKTTTRLVKTRHKFPINSLVNDLLPRNDISKASCPKNETSDKFWLSVEPLCRDVTKEDLSYIDELINECSQEIDFMIAERGDHYSVEFNSDFLENEVNGTNTDYNNELDKAAIVIDAFSNPLAYRLSGALISEKSKPSEFCISKICNSSKNGNSIEKKLRKELIEQGILDVEDFPKCELSEGEVVNEINKCVQELQFVSQKNCERLTRLRKKVEKSMQKQEICNRLEKIDNESIEEYTIILIEIQKQANECEDEPFEKLTLPKANLSEEETNRLIQEQVLLHRQLIDISNCINYY